MVQPSVPWPVLSHKLRYRVRPTYGTFDGVVGRRPVQNVAFANAPARGKSLWALSRMARQRR